jgi:apolipoprotein N-acyltransferase
VTAPVATTPVATAPVATTPVATAPVATTPVAIALAGIATIAIAARPWVHGSVAVIGFALLLIALHRLPAGTRRGAWAAAALTATLGLAIGVIAFEGAAPAAPLAYPALVLLTAAPWAAVGAVFARIRARYGAMIATVAFPASIVALEWGISRRFLLADAANGVATLAVTQFATPLARAAAWSGGSAVVLALLALSVACAWTLQRIRPPAWAIALIAAMLLPAAIPAPGRFVPAAEASTLRTAVAQGAVPSVELLFARFDAAAAERLLDVYAELTAGAAQRGATLIVWGETVIPRPLAPGEFPPALARALASAPAALIGGISRVGTNLHNAIFHYADATLSEVARKQVLVPRNERAFTPGVPLPALDVDGVGIGMGVCLDAVFASVLRDAVRRGAELLVIVTDDGFAGRTVTPELHLRHAALRAIETGRYLVFANQSGPSAIVAPTGAIVQRIEHGVRGGIVADVPALVGVTPFVRFGDTIGAFASAALLLMLFASNGDRCRSNGARIVSRGVARREGRVGA